MAPSASWPASNASRRYPKGVSRRGGRSRWWRGATRKDATAASLDRAASRDGWIPRSSRRWRRPTASGWWTSWPAPALGLCRRGRWECAPPPGAGPVAGQVEIVQQRRDGSPQSVGIVKAPSLLGEISLIMDGPHTATARALAHCELRFLSKEQFRRRIDSSDTAAHRLALGIAVIIARRLLRLNETLLDLVAGGAATPRIEDLAQLKQKIFSDWSF